MSEQQAAVSAASRVTSDDRLAVDAWEALFRAQSVLMRGFEAAPVWRGRSVKEYDVLYQLSRAEGSEIRQCDLVGRLMISQPSLSRLVDRLVAEGLVLRHPDPRDRRGSLLSLSAAGRREQRAIGAGHAKDVARALRGRLDRDELEQLRELARRLVAPECDEAEQIGAGESRA